MANPSDTVQSVRVTQTGLFAWGSHSWLQPAFSRPSAPEAVHYKGVSDSLSGKRLPRAVTGEPAAGQHSLKSVLLNISLRRDTIWARQRLLRIWNVRKRR